MTRPEPPKRPAGTTKSTTKKATPKVAAAVRAAKTGMTDEHKQALSIGRSESHAVRRYLDALEATRPHRGRPRHPETIARRLDAIEKQLSTVDALSRVKLIQERMNLEAEQAAKPEQIDLETLEAGFVAHAASYGARKGLSYSAWRSAGVHANVLRRAGIARTRS